MDPDTLRYIHENKTAALLTAALTMGLHFGHPSDAQLTQMRQIGYELGMAFQIIDDILDASSSAETMGKPVGNDAAADKSTYVALHGLEGAREQANTHTAHAIELCRALGGNTDFLVNLIRTMGERIH